jgi:hypothetical protein
LRQIKFISQNENSLPCQDLSTFCRPSFLRKLCCIVPVENLAEVRSLTVYNRWGQKVWEGTGLDAQWDGTFGGEPAASDVYVWLLRGGCGGELREKKGDVALLR